MGKGARPRGETVWSATIGAMTLGLAWEWVELREGVLMLRDPNTIITNVLFLDAELALETECAAISSANRLTHELPWQSTVTNVLGAERAGVGLMQSAPLSRIGSRMPRSANVGHRPDLSAAAA